MLAEQRPGPRPLTSQERAGAVRLSPSRQDPSKAAELERIKARFAVRASAQRALDAARDSARRQQARLQEFHDYAKAGEPNGPLTPAQVNEYHQIQAALAKDPWKRIERADEAFRASNYDAVHQALRP